MNPFFSILIPSYNRPEYIGQLIKSAFNSGVDDFEIIISDDKSPKQDEIENVTKKFRDKRIKFYAQSKNIGEVGNKNFLINKATGKYNILIGDDDFFNNNTLAVLKEYIIQNQDIDIFGLGYSTVDENDQKISKYVSPSIYEVNLSNFKFAKNIFCADMLPLYIFHPSTFCCKKGVEASLGYSYEVGMAEDMFFIYEAILKNYKILVIPENIFSWRKIIRSSKSDQSKS